MSGHSKWHNIAAKKGKADAARGRIFTKIGRELAIAVKQGGADPNSNSKLRDVISKAKAANILSFSLMSRLPNKYNKNKKETQKENKENQITKIIYDEQNENYQSE